MYEFIYENYDNGLGSITPKAEIEEAVQRKLANWDPNCVNEESGNYHDEVRLHGETFLFEVECNGSGENVTFDKDIWVKRVR